MTHLLSSYQWPLPHQMASSLKFFVDAEFDRSVRKWYWSDRSEIQVDQWEYDCGSWPHGPATELVFTITDKGIFSNERFLLEFEFA